MAIRFFLGINIAAAAGSDKNWFIVKEIQE